MVVVGMKDSEQELEVRGGALCRWRPRCGSTRRKPNKRIYPSTIVDDRWACGVVGYHVRFACERCPVQFRTCPCTGLLFLLPVDVAFDFTEWEAIYDVFPASLSSFFLHITEKAVAQGAQGESSTLLLWVTYFHWELLWNIIIGL